MSAARPVTRTDHRDFCAVEGWRQSSNARGGNVGHHLTFEFAHPDGRTLRTRISRPVKPQPYAASLAAHILRDQLEVTVAEFWACVSDRRPPVRAAAAAQLAETIPAGIVRVLLTDLHLAEHDVKNLTRAEAIRLVNDHWTGGA